MKSVTSTLDNKEAKLNIRKQLKYMQKHEMEPSDLIGILANSLGGAHQVHKPNSIKIIFKVDKKSTAADIDNIIRAAMINTIPTDKIDLHTLFRIHHKDGKVTVTAKRLNER